MNMNENFGLEIKKEIKFRNFQNKKAIMAWVEVHKNAVSDEELIPIKIQWSVVVQRFDSFRSAKHGEKDMFKLLEKVRKYGENYEKELIKFAEIIEKILKNR